MKDRVPILAAIEEYWELKKASFHFPAHQSKQNNLLSNMESLLKADLTEIPGLGDLHSSSGPIKEAQELAAKFFGAYKSYFLVNGASVGIMAAILANSQSKKKVLIPRNAHRSVFNALLLEDIDCRYLWPQLWVEKNILLNVHHKQFAEYLEKDDFAAVFLTHPDYLGLCIDINEISQITAQTPCQLLVDEAHGSHLYCSKALPKGSGESGADLWVHGTHKTGGAFTQGGMLHVSLNFTKIDLVEKYLSILQTTSPSYMIMASLDIARQEMMAKGESLAVNLVQASEVLKREINSIPGLSCLEDDMIKTLGYKLDPGKITIFVEDLAINGYQAESYLLDKGVYIEYATYNYILCNLSLWHKKEDSQKLVSSLKNMAKEYQESKKKKREVPLIPLFSPQKIMSIKEATLKESQSLSWQDALGRVCAEMITPYPPGIPLVLPGELLTVEMISYLKEIKKAGASFQGLKDKNFTEIQVVKE